MTSSADNHTLALLGLEVSAPVAVSPPLWDLLQRLVSEDRVEDQAAVLALHAEAKSARDFPVALLAGLLSAHAHYDAHALEDARRLAISTLELARETGNVLAEAHAYRLLALIAFDEGRSKDGHDHLLDAMAAFEDAGRPGEVPTLTRWYAEHLAVLGAKEEAEAAFRLARERFLAVGDTEGARLCELDLAALARK
jgi:hypothetical protein